MGRECFIGNKEKYMMENGLKGLRKGMEYGRGLKEIHILVNGRIVRLMGMECMCGRMGIDMRESGKLA
jgi:hypothetical protein